MQSSPNAKRKPRFLLTLSIFIFQLTLALAQTNPSTEAWTKTEKKIKPAAKSASKKSTKALLIDPSAQNPTNDSTFVYKIVEQMPSYPEGQAALLRHLEQNTQYPEIALKKKVQGIVVVQVTVERDGALSNVHVVKGIGAGCDEEALRVVGLMPKWKPGMQNGQAVPVQFNLPIRFKLDK
ncbi:energy transducer TonB [Haliscomenobacter hydrossis]|uniref:TonB family protein n=1 Tax=Haliscomenobacter hydrossis (strain ATCC 27775 / DSM 1100 / LMG 10767 / O) TaxID=760192 RepID=F4KS08_HALH1|nr:energy transducer TonB [Haliscomenobacter hydrossis]AEE51095.1 TonB family protein [Haliscomenobacter hydrossis DSM 1100]